MELLQKTILTLGFMMMVTPASAQETYAEETLPPVAALEAQQKMLQPMPEAEILPDIKIHPKTNPERVLFAHYKLSKTPPDFDSFAKLSPRVKRAQDIDKSAMAIAEYNRMTNRFNLLNPKEPIVVFTTLELDEYSSLQNIIVFDELDDKTYFKFPVYGENIGVVPKDIKNFNRIRISKESADKMFKDLSGSTKITAEFVLIPEFADRKTPFTFEDTDYWLMLAQIAEVRLWSKLDKTEQTLAWYYRNPNYKPEDKKDLGGLYSGE